MSELLRAAWDGQLRPDEIASLSADPWQIFKKPSRWRRLRDAIKWRVRQAWRKALWIAFRHED